MTKGKRCVEETAEVSLEVTIDDAKRATSSKLQSHAVCQHRVIKVALGDSEWAHQCLKWTL